MGNYVGLGRRAHCNHNGPYKREEVQSDSEKEKQNPEKERFENALLLALKRRKEP